MNEKLKKFFSGQEMKVFDSAFGEVTGIIQKCKHCDNDEFIVIFQEAGEGHVIQLVCPECDKPHFALTFYGIDMIVKEH